MPTLRQIQRRIRTIESTAKTTRAMSLVAASKMRRAQQLALSNRPYADQLRYLLADVVDSLGSVEGLGENLPDLLRRREVKTHGAIVITADRGLCGGLNTNLIRQASAYLTGKNAKIISVGRKGGDFFTRTNTEVLGRFTQLGDYPSYDAVRPISVLAAQAFVSGEVDSVSIIYPRFVNTVIQRPEILELLPLTAPEDHVAKEVEYIYEPAAADVLLQLLPRYVEIQVYRAILEMAASEQSARMVAMRNATDAASEMIQELTLLRNKLRQEQITKELLDITGGVEAMKAAGA